MKTNDNVEVALCVNPLKEAILNKTHYGLNIYSHILRQYQTNSNNDIEEITQRIETTGTDIAPNYTDWRDLGFALADALGESGRTYYHRLSRFYSGYAEKETDKQFNNCLKAHGNGVTIKTLYHLAKSAGIDVSIKVPSVPKVQKQTKSPISPR